MNREQRRAEAIRMRREARGLNRRDPRYIDGGMRNDDPYVTIELEMRRSTWLAVMDVMPEPHRSAISEAAGKAVKELEAERDKLDAEIDGLTDKEMALSEQLAELATEGPGQMTEAEMRAKATRITREAFILAGKEKEIPE